MTNISIKNIAEAIYETTLDKEGPALEQALEKSAIFLKDKNLLGKKDEILQALEKIINKEKGIVKIKVSSNKKIDQEILTETEDFIKKKYTAKEIITESEVDPKLLGGLKIEIGDDIIDGTLVDKIHQLQNYLITN